ncbi:hypothetical protein [Eoetvoesiella caeni]
MSQYFPEFEEGCTDPVNRHSDRAKYETGCLWAGLFFCALLPTLLVSATAHAQCVHPDGVPGELMFNSTYDNFQGCTTRGWMAFGGGLCSGGASGGLSGPTDCPEIGDKCTDTTIFAGWHPITKEQLFIPPTDANSSAEMAWKTSTGANDIATDSTYDGRINTDQIANSTDFPAFKACKDLTLAGKSWYLPSQVELYYLWSIRGMIEAKGNITNFQYAYYWSSTEDNAPNATTAWVQALDFGDQYDIFKTYGYPVRCMWR